MKPAMSDEARDLTAPQVKTVPLQGELRNNVHLSHLCVAVNQRTAVVSHERGVPTTNNAFSTTKRIARCGVGFPAGAKAMRSIAGFLGKLLNGSPLD